MRFLLFINGRILYKLFLRKNKIVIFMENAYLFLEFATLIEIRLISFRLLMSFRNIDRCIIHLNKFLWNQIFIFFIRLSVREADREWSLSSLRSVMVVFQLKTYAEEVDHCPPGQVFEKIAGYRRTSSRAGYRSMIRICVLKWDFALHPSDVWCKIISTSSARTQPSAYYRTAWAVATRRNGLSSGNRSPEPRINRRPVVSSLWLWARILAIWTGSDRTALVSKS